MLGAVLVAEAQLGHAHLSGPAAVAIRDQSDVLGQRACLDLPP
jgi:hypothetical protein